MPDRARDAARSYQDGAGHRDEVFCFLTLVVQDNGEQ
jgi:hypothetical protein